MSQQSSGEAGEKWREVREKERQQRETIQTIRAETSNGDGVGEPQQLRDLIYRLDENYNGIKNLGVAKADAEAFADLGYKHRKDVENMTKGLRTRDVKGFILNLKRKYREEEHERVDWEALGSSNNHLFNGVFPGTFMYGCLDVQPKVRKLAQRVQKEVFAEEKPAEITEGAGGPGKKQSHHEVMQSLIYKTLAKKKDTGYGMLDLLVNPQSFTQTVENIFEYAFLVKDLSEIQVGEDGILTVTAANFSGENAAASGETVPQIRQSVLTLTMKDWLDAKQLTRNADSLPHRTDSVYARAT